MHFGAWVLLGSLPKPSEILAAIDIPVEIMAEEEPPPLPPPPEPEPTPHEESPAPAQPVLSPPKPTPVRRPAPPKEPPTSQPSSPPPAEEQIADFTGETLTIPTSTWASAVGNGQDMVGPIGAPTGVVTGRRVLGEPTGVVGGGRGKGAPEPPEEPIFSLRDLREPPSPPELGRIRAALERLYPPRLRALNIEGKAVVRMRIRANGEVGPIRVRSATEPEFGDACVQALKEAGAWKPGLGPDGRPAATEVQFECEFALAR
ncbi:MAG: energy transducer TonB [Deltaproteobacteria bacterium]|nr:energy transducer TonB [Deltaproteobacteria bacterium]